LSCNSAFGTTELHFYIIFLFSKPERACRIVSCFYRRHINLCYIQESEEQRGTCASTGVTAQETHAQPQPSSHPEQRRGTSYLKHSDPTHSYLPLMSSRELRIEIEHKTRAGAVPILQLSAKVLRI